MMKNEWKALGAVCALVIGIYAYTTHSSGREILTQNAADSCYNLLVQGFRAGQLSLKKEAPPGLTRLADPYDPAVNSLYRSPPYSLLDTSYYKGRLYLYFGVTPALILLWPFGALTGHYLFSGQASAIFCAIGFLASVGVLRSLWRRYFPEVSIWVVAACVLALGLATGIPLMLPWCGVYEVPVSCGYMLTMLTLGAIWCALHEPERRWPWLAAASTAYGLAVGARPSLLFGAMILLVPVAQAREERCPVWAPLAAAIGPIAVIGLGLMLYNALRFGSPFEFGHQYQLTSYRPIARQFFHLRNFWFNFRVYFLEPVRWSTQFPFVQEVSIPPFPAGYAGVENPFGVFGVLTSSPLAWLALAAPLAWRERSGSEASTLRWFVTGVALLFGTCVLTLLFYETASIRYEVDFLPTLVLLAAVGVLGMDRALADRLVWRRAARWGWGVLLGFSLAVNILEIVVRCADTHNDLGSALYQIGKRDEAMEQYQQALRIKPDLAEAHCNLGTVFVQEGKVSDAIGQYEQALRIKPEYAEAHYDLGLALEKMGRAPEAIEQYRQALRIAPNLAGAHNDLGIALYQTGKRDEAMEQYQQALRLKPDYVEAHMNLGNALLRTGKAEEAVEQYQQALRINPDSAGAHSNLGAIYQRMGKLPDAVTQYELALRLKPDYVEAHFNLGLVLEKLGRTPEAIEHYQQALKIRPDFVPARNALTRLGAGQ